MVELFALAMVALAVYLIADGLTPPPSPRRRTRRPARK